MLDWFFKRKVRSVFHKNNKKRKFRTFKDMQIVMILFDYSDWEQISKIADDLRENGKKVFLWTFTPKNLKVHRPFPSTRSIKHDEFSFWGTPNAELLREFNSLRYDTLLNFSNVDKDKLDVMSYMLALNKAEFSVGIKECDDFDFFDFILLKEKNKTIFDTYEQIKFYCNSFHSIDM